MSVYKSMKDQFVEIMVFFRDADDIYNNSELPKFFIIMGYLFAIWKLMMGFVILIFLIPFGVIIGPVSVVLGLICPNLLGCDTRKEVLQVCFEITAVSGAFYALAHLCGLP